MGVGSENEAEVEREQQMAAKVNSKKCDNIEREKEELLSIEMQRRREGIQVEQACGRRFLRHYGKRRARMHHYK